MGWLAMVRPITSKPQ
ncbi:Protein of unknown function [Propionibacterium freudenreichii]|nr:Protein of unknown function [Propionibacterium freudenreichii]